MKIVPDDPIINVKENCLCPTFVLLLEKKKEKRKKELVHKMIEIHPLNKLQ
jgi:hypothetical protein